MAFSRLWVRAIQAQPSPEGDFSSCYRFPAVETAGYYEPSRWRGTGAWTSANVMDDAVGTRRYAVVMRYDWSNGTNAHTVLPTRATVRTLLPLSGMRSSSPQSILRRECHAAGSRHPRSTAARAPGWRYHFASIYRLVGGRRGIRKSFVSAIANSFNMRLFLKHNP